MWSGQARAEAAGGRWPEPDTPPPPRAPWEMTGAECRGGRDQTPLTWLRSVFRLELPLASGAMLVMQHSVVVDGICLQVREDSPECHHYSPQPPHPLKDVWLLIKTLTGLDCKTKATVWKPRAGEGSLSMEPEARTCPRGWGLARRGRRLPGPAGGGRGRLWLQRSWPGRGDTGLLQQECHGCVQRGAGVLGP